MFLRHKGTHGLVWPVCLALLCGPSVRAAAPVESPSPPGTSRIEGKIVRADGKTPAAGAVVRAVHLDTGKTYTSAPAGRNGEFEIAGLPFGYLDLSVETKEGVFLGNIVVNVPPGGSLALRLTLSPKAGEPSEWWAEQPRPGGQEPGARPAGVAEVRTKPSGREYWKSPAGLAIIGGSVGAVLLAIAAGGGGEEAASPSTP